MYFRCLPTLEASWRLSFTSLLTCVDVFALRQPAFVFLSHYGRLGDILLPFLSCQCSLKTFQT